MTEARKSNQEVEVKKESTKKGVSPIILQSIMAAFNPYVPVNQYLTADNDFYKKVSLIEAGRDYTSLPYLLASKVIKGNNKMQLDISKKTIGITAYNLLEGAVYATVQMYSNAGVKPPEKFNYRFLTQAYYLYTSLCVAIYPNGKTSLLTANPNVIDVLPVTNQNINKAKERMKMTTDDVGNGIIQCVEVVPAYKGDDIRPAIVNASAGDCCIIPKEWFDFFKDSIVTKLSKYRCKITCMFEDGSTDTIITTLMPCNNIKINYLRSFIKSTHDKYGFIRCINIKTNQIIAFPVNRIVSIEPII